MNDLAPVKASSTEVVPSGGKGLRVQAIRAAINFSDRTGLASFGDRAQKAAAEFADMVLARTVSRQIGDPKVIFEAMLSKARELDAKEIKEPGLLGKMFSNYAGKIEKFRVKFIDIAAHIDHLAIEVERHRMTMRSDIELLEDLYGKSVETIQELEDHIEAARIAVREMNEVELPAQKQAAAASGNLLDAQKVMDAERAVERLEKRIIQLAQARQICLQQLPQIRIIQDGNEVLAQNLDAALDLTIPAWKQKMVVVLGLARQRQAMDVDRAISDATGQLIRETANLVRGQAYEIDRRSQQGLVDVAALEEANASLIETINGLVQKQKEGKAIRAETERRLEVINAEMKAALASGA